MKQFACTLQLSRDQQTNLTAAKFVRDRTYDPTATGRPHVMQVTYEQALLWVDPVSSMASVDKGSGSVG